MKLPAIGLRVALCTMAVALAGVAQADGCLLSGTNASSAQADSGNGTYNCTLVSTQFGGLNPVTSGVTWSVDQVNGTVTWSVPVNANGHPTVDVDLVSVNRSSGKRCNYTYAEQKAGGSGLSTSDLGAATSVTFCADGVIAAEPPPPPPEPISTVGKNCDASFNYGETTGGKFDVAIGYSKQFGDKGYEGAAICAGSGEKDDQKQCINECVPRPIAEGTICDAEQDGRLPLECAPCVYDQPDPNTGLPYCWVYENKVADGYFKPSPKKKSLSANIDVSTGSDCYTVTVGPMYGGRTYSYYYCPPAQ